MGKFTWKSNWPDSLFGFFLNAHSTAMEVKYNTTVWEPLIIKINEEENVSICPLLSILSIPPSGDAGAPRLGCYSLSSAAALWLLKKLGLSSPPGTPGG